MFKISSAVRIAFAWIVVGAVAVGFHDVSVKAPPRDGGVDKTVAPGDDFFAYANGEWLAKTRIPAGKTRWGARDEIAAATAQRVLLVVSEAEASPEGRKVAGFFRAYLNDAQIEVRGQEQLRPVLEGIDAIRDNAGLSRWLGAQLRADVDPLGLGTYDSTHLFGFAASYGLHGETEYVAYLTQGGLGLGSRDAYFDETREAQAARDRYRNYIARMLKLARYDDPARRADAVLALETAIATSHARPADSAKDSNADNRWARGTFNLYAHGIDWIAFFDAAGLAGQRDFVVWQPSAIKGSAALVASEPLAVWKDYLRFHALDRYADVLPRRFAETALEFHGVKDLRAKRAVDATNRALPEAVGRLYVARYFPPESKARVQAILDNVVAAFRQRVERARWMSPESKRVALQKLETMYFGVGYPERWQDDSKLVILPSDALGNLRRAEKWSYDVAVAKLGSKVDRRQWVIAPQYPGAILNFQLNSYNFAAALLQPPKFDPAASEAAAYGAIGAIFGHEVSHFVDSLGADYDATGAARAWWTFDDKSYHDAATRRLVEQFSAYRPLPDMVIDGDRTLVENAADLGGLAAAFNAYRDAVGSRAADPQQLRSMDREFFIGFARAWRVASRAEGLRAMQGDTHAPEPYRIATVRNLEAWYQAFDVKPGDRLYLAPKERVRPVW